MNLLGLDEAFFREHWRRRPVVLRGAARALLSEVPSADELLELQARAAHCCTTDGKSVWFYQQLVHELPLTERLSLAGRERFEWQHVACDLVHTVGPASIGCHFDEDDNFSLQLVGAKRWRLSPPDTLASDLVRLRLLKEPDVGRATLGPEVTELHVEAGDVLYIPQLWIHWGESEGDSISISLVVNGRTFHATFAGSVEDALRHAPGWARAVPVGPGSTLARERTLDALVQQTFTPEAVEGVRPYVTAHRRPVPPLSLDMARARAFVDAAPPVPTAGFVLPASDSETHRVLRALLARRTLRRLLRVLAQRSSSTRCAADRLLIQQCIDALLRRTDAELERLCTEPELVSLAAIASSGESRYEDPLAAELARALLPELAALAAEPVPFSLLPDLDGAFTLRRAGVRLSPERPRHELVVRCADGAWQVFVDGRAWDPHRAPGLRVEPLPRLLGRGPHLSPAPTAWVARNVRDQELATADPTAFEAFRAAMGSGAERLAAAWPAAWDEVADGVRWLLPLPDRGLDPHNYSVHALRGLVVSSPRRDHRCAQTLAHEAGHNRLSTILDLLPLCRDPGQVVVSPVVDAERPMSFVFHGCFAFAQDVALTERLLPLAAAAERASMERYLDQCRRKAGAALDVLRRDARLTTVGSTVLEEIAQVLDR
ncbi:aKG-HExxH-type peptide beta-hydroxylase [Paraliomyxa miuraensis]|uniref:aKG-HExxH-type peptide beta-hydroxylase n=1 Tax=Paraliomyxa miuraensis TaxID=376150 RepID=UPI00225454D3|nr:HEXXH motif-containing putative peptide modification protein [Paraliomyxa miuraensis]MCX4245100.1 HEXXH motif-containing putative peptide modification protein [Paraliomyxa miuraensis]